MNKNYIWVALGGLIGGLVGYLIVRKKHSDEKVERLPAADDNGEHWAPPTERKRAETPAEKAAEFIAEREAPPEGDESYDGEVAEVTVENVKRDAAKRPYMITMDEFEYDDEYDKEALTYLEPDQMVVNDLNEVVFDAEKILGADAIDAMQRADGPDIVYVRNETYGIDYELTRVKWNYEYITGESVNDG